MLPSLPVVVPSALPVQLPASPLAPLADVAESAAPPALLPATAPNLLGADNRLLTADYPHYVRRAIEEACPGATAMFVTGCAGDANTGHSAHASWTLEGSPARSFEAAERLGRRIADAALAAGEAPLSENISARAAGVLLHLTRLERMPLRELAMILPFAFR